MTGRILYYILLVTFTCNSWRVQGQISSNTGLLLDDQSYKKLIEGGLQHVKDHHIPVQFSLKAYTPLPKSQGKIASCVGWATGYYAWTIERAFSMGITDRAYITDHIAHSALFIYQQIKRGNDCQSLASITDALDFINQKGDCLEKTFPTSSIKCSNQLSTEIMQEAAKFRNPSPGFKVFGLNANQQDKLKAVKAHLSAGHPIIVGMSETPPYASLIGKKIWNIEPLKKGGHAMVLIGYSDSHQRIEVINSYGSTWGNNGTIEISYADFTQYCQQAFVLNNTLGSKSNFTQPVDLQINLQAQIEINRLDHVTKEKDNIAFEFNKNHYKPIEKTKPFDPLILDVYVEKARCAYLLHIGPKQKCRLIWSLEYPIADTIVTVPDQGWWEFSTPGKEVFCLLYSYETLNVDQEILDKITSNPAKEFYLKVLNTIGSNSCRTDVIQYQSHRLEASAGLRSGYEKVLPLFFYFDILSE